MTARRWDWGLLTCLLLVLMQEYSRADTSVDITSGNQHSDSAAVPTMPATTETSPSAGEPEGATEELIAGRGFQTFQYKGISFAPGGFFDGTAIFRSANENADIQSTFANIPFQGSANSHLREFRGTARGSRLNLLSEGHYRSTAIAGYVELDFLGSSTSGNELETNSWNPRLRQLWGNVDLPGGISLLFGQSWSLLTTHRI
ncbi:MAG TPA: hypothetical protein VJQ25_13900 [Nitrospira sp.]|nr:hypothetical protein [Nitrospira sp.]